MAPHCWQVASVGLATFQWALRRRVLDRDIFFLGTAMSRTSLRSTNVKNAVGRRRIVARPSKRSANVANRFRIPEPDDADGAW